MAVKLPVTRKTNLASVRNHLATVLTQVQESREHVVIERSGQPIAVIISMEDYDDYQRLLTESFLNQLGQAVGHVSDSEGLTEDILNDELSITRRQVFVETYASLA